MPNGPWTKGNQVNIPELSFGNF